MWTVVWVRRLASLDGTGWLLLLLAAIVVATGLERVESAVAVIDRVWPVLAFLVLITVASAQLESIGLFDTAARRVARWGRGRTWVLFALFVVLCTVCTTTLSLDATAVLLAPVAVTLASELELDPLPFAVACLWLANTASLTLPVANLTNLLAQEESGWDTAEFVSRTWAVQLAVLATTVLWLALVFRRQLRGRYVLDADRRDPDRVQLGVAMLGVLAFGVAVVAGVEPWAASAVLVAVLALARGVRTRAVGSALTQVLRNAPWATTAFALGLFLLMDEVSRRWAWLAGLAVGDGEGVVGLLRIEAVGALAANLLNNLPAYLALERSVHGPAETVALLVGVNAGPLVTPWASLATLLWVASCRERGLRVSPLRLALLGLGLVPCLLLAGAAALAVQSLGR